MNKIWSWLSGKKALIGLTMLWLSDRLWIKDLLPDGTIESATIDFLIYIGGALAGVGFLHKMIKQSETKPYHDEIKPTS